MVLFLFLGLPVLRQILTLVNELLYALLDPIDQVLRQVHCQVGLHHHAEHGLGHVLIREQRLLLLCYGVGHAHRIAAHVPMIFGNGMLEVDVVKGEAELRVEAHGDHGKATGVTSIQHLEDWLAI